MGATDTRRFGFLGAVLMLGGIAGDDRVIGIKKYRKVSLLRKKYYSWYGAAKFQEWQ